MTGGREHFVALDALRPGVIFRVKPGERIPADGVIIEGRSHTDEAVITGESAPVAKRPGDPVVCGSINTENPLDVRAPRVGAESTLAQIACRVEQACANRTTIERAVDRVSRLFIPAVLAIAVLTFAYAGLVRAIAVLVIACPCALGIATPLALTAAVTAAGRRGSLVNDTRVLETIRDVNIVVLDKTGTVTMGEFTLLDAAGDTSRMTEVAAVESCSPHPIAKAIVAHVGGLPLPAVADVVSHPGMGISGVVGQTRYFIGNRALAQSMAAPAGDSPDRVLFGWEGQVHGSLSFGDRLRPGAKALCDELRARGIRTVLL